jgi:pilus assembly protein CpaC
MVLLALGVLACGAAAAQEVPGRRLVGAPQPAPRALPVPSVSAAPLSVPAGTGTADIPRVAPENGVVTVTLNKARIIELPAAAQQVMLINEGIADVHVDRGRPNQLLILPRNLGTTSLMVLDRNGQVVFQSEIRVDVDTSALKAALAKVLPNEAIEATTFHGAIFLTGSVRSPRAAAQAMDLAARFLPQGTELVNMLKVKGSQQVILKVRVAEMSRSVVKDLAVSSNFNRVIGGRKINLSTVASPLTTSTMIGTGTVALKLFGFSSATFQALEKEGLVRTLAEPTLVALSGETANFLSGGETPYPSAMDENGNITYAFRTTGIKLNFTPVVLDEGLINLQVASEVSEIDANNRVQFNADFVVNGTKTKRTETVIDLSSGGSLMISGLLRDDTSSNVTGVPFFKDIPGVGALFRSVDHTTTQTELVVLVTAYLAAQIDSPSALYNPVDGYVPPSDIDMYLLGRLHREYTKDGPIPAGRLPFTLDGPYGYILEGTP